MFRFRCCILSLICTSFASAQPLPPLLQQVARTHNLNLGPRPDPADEITQVHLDIWFSGIEALLMCPPPSPWEWAMVGPGGEYGLRVTLPRHKLAWDGDCSGVSPSCVDDCELLSSSYVGCWTANYQQARACMTNILEQAIETADPCAYLWSHGQSCSLCFENIYSCNMEWAAAYAFLTLYGCD